MSASEDTTKLHLSDVEDGADSQCDENDNSARRKDAYKPKRHHTDGEYDQPLLEPSTRTQEVADGNSNGDYELPTRPLADRQTEALEQMLKTLQQLVPPKKGWHLKLLKSPKETTDTIATIARNKSKVLIICTNSSDQSYCTRARTRTHAQRIPLYFL